mmetsp:Transcript_28596/g.66252  ORF Transcript_28596/g.66252 Transcript_28596/m.66252 type:complete len:367 (-) Transcript_28596:169-1269(-)
MAPKRSRETVEPAGAIEGSPGKGGRQKRPQKRRRKGALAELDLDDLRTWNDDLGARGKKLLRNVKYTFEENQNIMKAMKEFSGQQELNWDQLQENLRDRRSARYTWSALAKLADLEHRSVQSIAKRARRLLWGVKSGWTDKEVEDLKRLVLEHGPAWKEIASEMGLSAEQVRDKWRSLCVGGLQYGRRYRRSWTEMEIWCLREGVLETTDSLAPVADIPWQKVHNWVPSRGPWSCMAKWYLSVLPELLEYRDKHGHALPPQVFHRNLIRNLKKSKLSDILWVNWLDVNKWWPASTNRRAWRSLRIRHLPAELLGEEDLQAQVRYLYDALQCRDNKKWDKRLLRHARRALDAEAEAGQEAAEEDAKE